MTCVQRNYARTFSVTKQRAKSTPTILLTEVAVQMANPWEYFVDERKDETFAVKGRGKQRAARVVTSEGQANKLAHHFAGRDGVVEHKGPDGRFECTCARCRSNRRP
jgi:hypothetical protein